MTQQEVKEILGDNVTFSKGVYFKRMGFFYTHGKTSQNLADRVQEKIPSAIILDHGEKYLPFRGGEPLIKNSHWWVKFKLPKGE